MVDFSRNNRDKDRTGVTADELNSLIASLDSATSALLSTTNSNLFLAGPSSGPGAIPTYRGIVANDLPDGVFTTSKIPDLAITEAKLSNTSVTSAKIADSAITTDKLSNTTVSPGTYTNATITVDAKGRITSAVPGTVYGATYNDITLYDSADDTYYYMGGTAPDSSWVVIRYTIATQIRTRAIPGNNGAYLTLDNAWSARAILLYV